MLVTLTNYYRDYKIGKKLIIEVGFSNQSQYSQQ